MATEARRRRRRMRRMRRREGAGKTAALVLVLTKPGKNCQTTTNTTKDN
eukprot:CAMPEP_0206454388 /NCGR_PEP_ID=MMETSP0324_2-20121206/21107_1 /ASSEMBLY_ACC=CAM_ASM_000836 /TAXON_ID=2866 /ORGANISM="Crypthecodinium cohnii, Strain Seligo" /LENGTH=48 /DNA_ID= /DNA_START= /DNA_END= /DNA_ORIENTATION=